MNAATTSFVDIRIPNEGIVSVPESVAVEALRDAPHVMLCSGRTQDDARTVARIQHAAAQARAERAEAALRNLRHAAQVYGCSRPTDTGDRQ